MLPLLAKFQTAAASIQLKLLSKDARWTEGVQFDCNNNNEPIDHTHVRV